MDAIMRALTRNKYVVMGLLIVLTGFNTFVNRGDLSEWQAFGIVFLVSLLIIAVVEVLDRDRNRRKG